MKVLKNSIKKLLIGKEERNYIKKLESKKMDYNKWVQIVETDFANEKSMVGLKTKSLTIELQKNPNESENASCDRKLAESDKLCKLIQVFSSDDESNCETQYVVCTPKNLPKALKTLENNGVDFKGVILQIFDGEISDLAIKSFHNKFMENESLIMIYSDEDVLRSDGERVNPWFKPDWSPDTFLSHFYFGSLVAIRADVLKQFEMKDEDIYEYLYKLLLFNRAFDKHTADEVVGHIPYVLFHSYNKSSYEAITRMSIPFPLREKIEDTLISVIIPSKDHPDILFRCIDSFLEKTCLPLYLKVEFVVVDNGSNEINKSTIEGILDSYRKINPDTQFKYIYEKETFNFSHMCNKGAENADGEYYLFLNDDMEIIEEDWLIKLFSKAVLPYAGAVGAKLIYPQSTYPQGDVIQHAGITNLRIGPAHKLQHMSDKDELYFGKNRYCFDMIGVTGACLLVKKAVFNEAGAFDENLAVAFNDVDLCFKIYELGYYNIERNDVRLLHHESLSRGNDSESAEKMQRLTREKDYLYEKHREIYGKDPFYNINLTTDMLESEYAPKYHYEVRLDADWARVSDITSVISKAKEDACVRVGMECAMDIFKWKYGVSSDKIERQPEEEEMGFYFQGYTFVIGSNNACFERTLLLENTESGQVFGIEVNVEYRPDIKSNLKDQLNVDLTGYTAKITADSVPKGNYRFGMYMKDKTSSLRLYNWSNWTLTV